MEVADEVDRAVPPFRRPSEIVTEEPVEEEAEEVFKPSSLGDAIRRGSTTFGFNWRAPLALLPKKGASGEELNKLALKEAAIFDHTEDEETSTSFANLRLEFVQDERDQPAKEPEARVRKSSSLEWLLREHEQLLEYDELLRDVRRHSVSPVSWFRI